MQRAIVAASPVTGCGKRAGEKRLWDERDGMREVSSEMGIKRLLQAARDKGKRKREWEIGRGGGG